MDAKLSESAVGTLRLEMMGIRARDSGRDLPNYRELTDFGIMERVADAEYRFTTWGLQHREEILARESERIERERFDPPDRPLSDSATRRLRLHLAGDKKVTEENRPAYRELVAARVMIPVHTFVGGREAAYQLTYWGYKLRDELLTRSKETA